MKLGYFATAVWALVSLTTAFGILHDPSRFMVNAIMVVAFTFVALHLGWRGKIMRDVRTAHADSLPVARLELSDRIGTLAMCVIGVISLSGALSRVLGEHEPVFG